MKKIFTLFFILGLLSLNVTFATEDQSGGDCSKKVEANIKEEIANLNDTVESESEVSTSSDQ